MAKKPTSAEFSNKNECCVVPYAKAQLMARESAKAGIRAQVQPYWNSYSLPALHYIPDPFYNKGYRIERDA